MGKGGGGKLVFKIFKVNYIMATFNMTLLRLNLKTPMLNLKTPMLNLKLARLHSTPDSRAPCSDGKIDGNSLHPTG